MIPPEDDSPSDFPYFHYMSERDRLHRHSATKRTTVLASLPDRCPYRARASPKNSKKLELGWLEFHSSEPPEPEVARPGDVWIQIPLDFDPMAGTPDPAAAASLCRLFVCYSAEGCQWTEWEGDECVHTDDPPVGIHPLASPAMWGGTTKRDAQFYLAFTGSEFTWVSGTRLAIIAGQWRLGRLPGDWMKRLIAKHSIDGIPFLSPAEAIAAWAERKTLTASGIQIKKKDKKRVSNEPTPELPGSKRRKPENESSNPGVVAVAQDWRPVVNPERLEPETISYPYSFVSWPHVPHWTVMQPSFPRPSTPPSSNASDEPMGSPKTPPLPNFVLRPATFALPPSPADESPPSDDPPPTPPSPVPQLQPPQTESRPPPTVYPHVSFTPTLSPPRYGERPRKRVIPSSTQPASAGPSASAMSSTSVPTSSSEDPSMTSALSTNSGEATLVANGRRAPVGAIDAAPGVRGKYAKAGAVQRGWSLYVADMELLMPFPCDKCERAGAICSGLEGERCGRCRAIRKPCSHNAQPRPSRSKSDPPLRARFAIPVSSSTFVKSPAAALAFSAKRDVRLEAPNRRPGSERMNPSDVLKPSATRSAPILPQSPSSRALNNSPAESQDEDDNVVEELMDREEGEEENVGVETACLGIAQVDTVVSAIVGPQEPVAAFVISRDAIPDHAFTRHDDSTQDGPNGNAHLNTPIASVCKVTDVDISTGAPTTTVKSLDCQGGTGNKHFPQSGVEDLEGSNILSNTDNNYASGPFEEHCHVGSVERWNPRTMHTDDSPLPDPAGDPAPDCSQEVCIHAADGAAAGGGLPSPTRFTPVTGPESGASLEDVDPRTGYQQIGAASPLSAPPHEERTSITPPPPSPQMADEDPPRTSVDEEIVRYMEITLNGMAQVQDGLRGVFAIQGRRRAVQKRKMAVGDKYSK